ncbi:diguanylate cyclase domain-containing protein [Roseovarius sp. C7]|uniref:diguanylate cyclase domain-containing protein n=1 Tax=Roseovarius sp. C7 TaxID=3398643 RepID=UPI0039F68373
MTRGATPLAGLFDALCPMHALLDGTGHVVHVGPTLARLCPQREMKGARFLELFELRRPARGATMHDLRQMQGRGLHFVTRDAPRLSLKAVLTGLPDDAALGLPGGALVNMSFGIAVTEAIRRLDLTARDFAATDLTVEMLYLIEAKTAAMEASRLLNLRLQGAKAAAEEQAYTDTLTGLRNRRALDPVLMQLMTSETDFALIQLDLDYFKEVNDQLGHAAGDHVLQAAARAMQAETRKEDVLLRVGGDEFVLILTRVTDAARVRDIAERVIARLEKPVEYDGQPCHISASAGGALSCLYRDPKTVEARIMEDADIALYEAKSAGRGCYRSFEPGMRLDRDRCSRA